MTDTLTFIHGGLYDGLDLNSKQNIRNLSLAEEDTSANKIYCACFAAYQFETRKLFVTEKQKSINHCGKTFKVLNPKITFIT